jgi:hypothetical protein
MSTHQTTQREKQIISLDKYDPADPEIYGYGSVTKRGWTLRRRGEKRYGT